jgi:serine/threonine protein kinase
MDGVLKVAKTYELKTKLGSGAFGEIYKAFNSKDNKDYAVKLEERRCKYP